MNGALYKRSSQDKCHSILYAHKVKKKKKEKKRNQKILFFRKGELLPVRKFYNKNKKMIFQFRSRELAYSEFVELYYKL